MTDQDDERRVAAELARCHRASLDVTALAPPLRTRQLFDAQYHAERHRILGEVGVPAAVAFLREEALAALAGRTPNGRTERWFRLHFLEFGGSLVEHTADLMEAGVRKLVHEGVADVVAESSRGRRL